MPISTRPIDEILLGASGVLFLGLGAWTLFGGTGDASPPELPAPGPNATHHAAALSNPESAPEIWAAPKVPEGASEWLFDVFTPPVIYYDIENQEFSVTPPDSGMGGARAESAPFGLELVEVKRTPYRIQLVGYVGSEGDYIATFEDVDAGETFLARPGRPVEGPGIVVLSLRVEKVREQLGGGSTVHDTRATAVIRDLRQDREVTLVQKTRFMNDVPTAVFRVPGAFARRIEGKRGETLTVGDARYTVGLVTLEPPAAEVTLELVAESRMEVRRLEPATLIEPVLQPSAPRFQFPPHSQNRPVGLP